MPAEEVMSDTPLTIEQVREGTRTGHLRWRRGKYGNSVELFVAAEKLSLQADPPRLFRRTVAGVDVVYGYQVAALLATVKEKVKPRSAPR